MSVREWRTSRVLALVFSYWMACLLVAGLVLDRATAAAMVAYREHRQPRQGVLVRAFDAPQLVLILAVAGPPLALLSYHAWVRRRSATRPAV